MHPTLALCREIREFLNDPARTWRSTLTPFTAITQVITGIPKGELGTGWHVIVAPLAIEGEPIDRDRNYQDEHQIGIGFIRKLPVGMAWNDATGGAWVEEQLGLLAPVLADLRENAVTVTSDAGEWKDATYQHRVLVSDGPLKELNVFVSLIQGTFKSL